MGKLTHILWEVSFAVGSRLVLAVGVAATGTSLAFAQKISFDQILDAPDDLELNLRYARQQVASGRLQQAAAALERLLLLKPNWDSARLFYGIVLYRLDDLNGSIRELNLLENRDLSSSQESDRIRYLALARKKSSPVRLSARISLGVRADTNPQKAADDPTLNFTARENFGSAFIASDNIRLEVDAGVSGNYFFFQTNDHLNERFSSNSSDSATTRAHGGIVLHGPGVIVTPYVIYGTSWIQHERFRQNYGGGLDTRWTLSSKVDFLLNGKATYQDYRKTSYSSIGDLRDGWRTSLQTGFKYRLTDSQIFKLKGQFARKNADFDGYSYDEGKVSASSLTLFGKGRYLSLNGYYQRKDFDQPDHTLSEFITRKDDLYYARAAVGAPLGTLFSAAEIELPETLSDIVAQLGVSYTHQESSIGRLRFDNWSGDITFSKRFRF